uniref:SDR family oxidoreductase n=1 Tax=Bacteroidota TaxID=976 RepID=UPI0040474CE8
MKKKILIAGGAGMLGNAFYEVFAQEYEILVTDIDLNEPHIQHMDFRVFEEYKAVLNQFKPDYLFHLGAHTSLEYCEENISDCYATNTIAVEHAVRLSNSAGIPLLYISTAGIFDGSKDVFTEFDTPNPLGHYAKSKYYGERFVCESSTNYLICRAGWMMGGGLKKDKKFIGKILKQISSGSTELFIVDDKDGTPTLTFDFARNVKKLIEKDVRGLYNMVCGGMTSRLEVAQELLSILGRNDIKINLVNSNHFSKTYYAPRPSNERLINLKLNIIEENHMRDWKVALEDYVTNIYFK